MGSVVRIRRIQAPAGETGRLKVRMTPSLMAAESQKKNKRHIAISGMLALGVHGVRFKRDLVTSLVSQKKCED